MVTKAAARGTKPVPGAHKHSPTELEEVLERVAVLDRRGWTQHQIAREVSVSQPMVCGYLKKIRERYKTQQLQHREEAIEEKLEQYREIRREAWAAWERSKEDARSKTVQTTKAPPKKPPNGEKGDAPDTGTLVESQARIMEIVTTEGRLPANPYLATIMETLKAERELLGLDQAKKVDVRSVTVDWNRFMERRDATDAIKDGDEIEAAIASVKPGVIVNAVPKEPYNERNGTEAEGGNAASQG